MNTDEQKKLLAKANQLIDAAKIETFPIKVNTLIDHAKSIPNLFIVSYTDLSNFLGCSIEELSLKFGTENAILLFPERTCETYLYYNDTFSSNARITWSIAHELAHLICGHNHLYKSTSRCGLTLSQQEKEVIEIEANFFARHLLAPLELIYLFRTLYHAYQPSQLFAILRAFFHLSIEASYYTVNALSTLDIKSLIDTKRLNYYAHTHPFFKNCKDTFKQDQFTVLLRKYEPEYPSFSINHFCTSFSPQPPPQSTQSILDTLFPRENANLL